MKIDLFVLGETAFDRSEFSRRRRVRVRADGTQLFVKSAEDSVLRKLLWYRAGGAVSSKQWRDLVEILRVSGPQLDFAYLVHWADDLDVAAELARARAEAG